MRKPSNSWAAMPPFRRARVLRVPNLQGVVMASEKISTSGGGDLGHNPFAALNAAGLPQAPSGPKVTPPTSSRKAFTLIEFLLVFAIIAIFGIAAPSRLAQSIAPALTGYEAAL